MNQSPSQPDARKLAAIVLAAGKGTRMHSDLPKVVHDVADQPMIRWVVDACREAGASPIVLVIGHGAQRVREVFTGDDDDLAWAVQEPQLGTAHAAACAGEALRGFDGDVLVLAGDGPLIRGATLRSLHEHHRSSEAAATLATARLNDPSGYGRVIRDERGEFERIVEHRNATRQQQAINEVYPSYACFDARLLFEVLVELKPDARSGEYFITEVPAVLRERGGSVALFDGVPAEEVRSINTPGELAEVGRILEERLHTATEKRT